MLLQQIQNKEIQNESLPKLGSGQTLDTQQSDPDVLQKTYDFETNPPGFTKDLKVSDAGLQGILDFLSTTVRPEAAKASSKDFYDTTILDRLEK